MNFLRRNYERLKWALTPKSRKQALLDDAISVLKIIPQTHDLLDLAKAEGISIGFSAKLIGSGAHGHVLREKNTGETRIELSPRATAEEIAETLIHELRHVWQNNVLGTGATTTGREESSAEMTILMTRVKEADAFAFSLAMVREINYACQLLSNAVDVAKRMMAKNEGMALNEFDIANIGHILMASAAHEPPPDTKKIMAEMFTTILPAMDDYDRLSLDRYRLLYTHAWLDPVPHVPAAEAIDIPKLRKILKAGISPNAPVYLDNLDDVAFSTLVMTGLSPKIRDTISLMDAFESAAAKGTLSANDNKSLLTQIDKNVRDVQAAPPINVKSAMKKQAANSPS